MKQLPTEMFTITEIGGVGEMVYKAVRFPECVPEYDHERKEDIIVPICTFFNRPEAGTDYSITGQDLLVSLCNLYKKINELHQIVRTAQKPPVVGNIKI